MKIGNIDTNEKVFIIAEIGNNHEGDFEVAKKMITLAAEAGADAVKFQTIVPELFISALDAERMEKLKSFQFSYDQFKLLADCAQDNGLIFLSTPFDIQSAHFLDTIQPAFKIASGDNDFFPLIDSIAGFKKPMIVSTGLCNLDLIQDIHDRIKSIWHLMNVDPGLALLHCVTSYPTPFDQASLGAIHTLKTKFSEAVIGYSDHTLGIDASTYAVAAGARIIEKHFTLDKNYSDFRDHQLSADPNEMGKLVKSIKHVQTMMGDNQKILQACETGMDISCRRSIAAGMALPAGTTIKSEHLTWLRPGGGLKPGEEDRLLDKVTVRDLAKGEQFKTSDVKSCVE